MTTGPDHHEVRVHVVRHLQQRRGVSGAHDHLHADVPRPHPAYLRLDQRHGRFRHPSLMPAAGLGRLTQREGRHVVDDLEHAQRSAHRNRHVRRQLERGSRRLRTVDTDEQVAEAEPIGCRRRATVGHDQHRNPSRLQHMEAGRTEGELRLITTLTSFATAVDITLSELHLEASLPADEATADILRRRAERS
jgi:hypothetical protein